MTHDAVVRRGEAELRRDLLDGIDRYVNLHDQAHHWKRESAASAAQGQYWLAGHAYEMALLCADRAADVLWGTLLALYTDHVAPGRYPPAWLAEALNSGDGSYRP